MKLRRSIPLTALAAFALTLAVGLAPSSASAKIDSDGPIYKICVIEILPPCPCGPLPLAPATLCHLHDEDNGFAFFAGVPLFAQSATHFCRHNGTVVPSFLMSDAEQRACMRDIETACGAPICPIFTIPIKLPPIF